MRHLKLVVVIGLVAVGSAACSVEPLRTDQELISFFHEHQAQFDELVGMVLEDDVVAVRSSYYMKPIDRVYFGASASGLPASRWDQYRELFKTLNLRDGVVRVRTTADEGIGIVLPLNTRRFVGGAFAKGIMYSELPPEPQRDSLDAPIRIASETGAFFKPIAGKWYLFYTNEY